MKHFQNLFTALIIGTVLLISSTASWADNNRALVGNWIFKQCEGTKDFRIEFSGNKTTEGYNTGKMYRPDCTSICGDSIYDIKWKVEGDSLLIYNTYQRLCMNHPDFAWEGPDSEGGPAKFSINGNELRINSTTYRRQ